NNLGFVADPIIDDVEKVAYLLQAGQARFPFFPRDVFAHHDHPVFTLASDRLIIEVGHLFALQPQRFKTTLADDAVFDIVGAWPFLGLGLVTGWPSQLFPGPRRHFVRDVYQIGPAVEAEEETDAAIFLPAVQVFGRREMR